MSRLTRALLYMVQLPGVHFLLKAGTPRHTGLFTFTPRLCLAGQGLAANSNDQSALLTRTGTRLDGAWKPDPWSGRTSVAFVLDF